MITDGRSAAAAALCAGALLAGALAPSAGASLQPSLDAGGLVLTDVTGSADDVTLSTNKAGLFVAVADKANTLEPVCPLGSAKFHGFQCAPAPLVRIDSGAGDDRIDATRLATPLAVTLGPGSDVLQAGSANDTVTTVADGQRDVVDCGAGQDTVEGMADPNDELAATCETAQRSFEPAKLPKALTVGPASTITVAIGRADVPLGFAATLSTAPPKGSAKKGRTIARAKAAQATGPAKLRFKLPKLSSGFLSRRPELRVQIDVDAIAADGRRFPLSLHSGSPGPLEAIALHDNQLRLKLPAKLRHPHGR
jgi:hypothetical protein